MLGALFLQGDEVVLQVDLPGKYLKKNFLDFMQNGALCLNRTAHNALVEVVDVNDLSELFDQQEQLYCDWIKNTETKYESNYVSYPQASCR